MRYSFTCSGHENITARHKTTLEFTKDKDLTLKGDCIIGVNADFSLSSLKEFVEKINKKSKDKKIIITIKPIIKNKANKKIEEIIVAEINPGFNSDSEIVIRKTDFLSERTFAIRANKAAFGLNGDLINFLKKKTNKITVSFESR